ncbi:MAG: caspase family protein [Thermodesulfobacteriota bacterium]
MKRLTASIFVYLLFCFYTSPALAEDRALLVGVGHYHNPKHDLPGIDKDLAAMREICGLLGFQPEQVMTLEDGQATIEAVRRAVEGWLVKGTGQDDRALFYFSGHGSRTWDQDGDEPDNSDEVLVTYDFGPSGDKFVSGLVDDEFGTWLDRIPARMTFVFLDACHSGTATRRFGDLVSRFLYYEGMPPSREGFRPITAKRGGGRVLLLSAAQDDELAVGNDEGGYFTGALADAIRRAAAQGTGLTMQELQVQAGDYIQKNMSDPALVHHPNLYGDLALAGVDLFRSSAPVPAAASPPAQEPARPADLWSQLEALADQASYHVPVTVNKSRLKMGENLVVTCRVGGPGYLNVLHLTQGEDQAAVLFPNKYHQQNQVGADATVTIPGPGDGFALKAQPPAGQSLVVIFHTQKNVNAYINGVGDPAALFRNVNLGAARNLFLDQAGAEGYGAGKVVTVVEE